MSSILKQGYAEVQSTHKFKSKETHFENFLQKSVLAESNIVNKVTPSGENRTWENLNYRNF